MFGQFVIGPPGAGKTTYCDGMQQMMTGLKRKNIIVNLDPANDLLPYDCAVDVRDLISVEAVMDEFNLGPNGGLVFAMEYIDEHFDWLVSEIKKYTQKRDVYILFDCPGQVELYACHDIMNNITTKLMKQFDLRLTCVHLIDSTLCTDGFRYLSAVLVALTSMTHLEMAHVNILSKMDILGEYAQDMDFRLDFYVGVEDLSKLVHILDDSAHPMAKKFRKFTQELVEVVEDYNLVRFEPLDIQDKDCVLRVLAACDQANGRIFAEEVNSGTGGMLGSMWEDARTSINDYIDNFHEKYVMPNEIEDEVDRDDFVEKYVMPNLDDDE